MEKIQKREESWSPTGIMEKWIAVVLLTSFAHQLGYPTIPHSKYVIFAGGIWTGSALFLWFMSEWILEDCRKKKTVCINIRKLKEKGLHGNKWYNTQNSFAICSDYFAVFFSKNCKRIFTAFVSDPWDPDCKPVWDFDPQTPLSGKDVEVVSGIYYPKNADPYRIDSENEVLCRSIGADGRKEYFFVKCCLDDANIQMHIRNVSEYKAKEYCYKNCFGFRDYNEIFG